MQVKIIHDFDDGDYIAFIDGINSIQGYGNSEREAVLDFLNKCVDNPKFNQTVISNLISKIQYEHQS